MKNQTALREAGAPGLNGAAQRGGGHSERLLQRRRALPGGRALVGGFLVAVAAVGVFAAYANATAAPERSWVVASRPVAAGQRLTAGDVAMLPIDLPEALAANAYASRDRLVDAITIAPLEPFELIQGSDVVLSDGPASAEEISFRVEAARALGGTLRAGERVDVLATYGNGESAFTVPVVRAAAVLATDALSGALASETELVLRLGLDGPQDALAVAHAVAAGQLAVVRTTAVTSDAEKRPSFYRPASDGRPGGQS